MRCGYPDFSRFDSPELAFAGAPGWRRFRSWRREHRRRLLRAFIHDFMHGRGHRHHDRGHWEDWGPFASFAGGPRGRFFEPGEARLAILSLLQEGPKHGYQIIKEMEQRSGGLYRASAGTVYPTLQQLQDEQSVKSEEIEGRKVYSLLPAGSAEIEREKENIARIWQRAEHWEDWGHGAGPGSFPIFGPLGSVVKAAFRAARWAGSSEERREKVIEILENAKRALKDLREE